MPTLSIVGCLPHPIIVGGRELSLGQLQFRYGQVLSDLLNILFKYFKENCDPALAQSSRFPLPANWSIMTSQDEIWLRGSPRTALFRFFSEHAGDCYDGPKRRNEEQNGTG